MTPARTPRPATDGRKLLVVDPSASDGAMRSTVVTSLPSLLSAGDVLVVNDSATMPASLTGHTARGDRVEARLLAPRNETWTAILFGDGDWRARTEDRPSPLRLDRGDRLTFGDDATLTAEVLRQDGRHVVLRFEQKAAEFWPALYRLGRPVQYAHMSAPLALWDVQTAFASRPWSSEMPSAGFPLTWATLLELRRRGVTLATLTHAAGLSSTGDDALDRSLPLPERFSVPEATMRAVAEAKRTGARVVAVGTSVTRALESTAGAITSGITDLVIGPGRTLRVVDALLTGMHERGTSHFELLSAFCTPELLARALGVADAEGYRSHEFGDAMLLLRS